MTITHSGPEPTGKPVAGGSGVRINPAEIRRFGHPHTRMLLASDGFTMPTLEALLGTELEVRVLRQDDLAAGRLPIAVTDALQVSGADRVIVRRSYLVGADMVTASVNYVVAVPEPAAASGLDNVHTPIGTGLISRGVSQRRHILRAGVMRWPDGRLCAARAYIMLLGDRPVCYIREAFNPDVIPPDATGDQVDWADEPDTADSGSDDLPPVPLGGGSREAPRSHSDAGSSQSVQRFRSLRALVHPGECDALTADFARAVHGEAFVLYLAGGADTSAAGDTRSITAHRALMHAAAAVLTHGMGKRVTTIRLTRRSPEPLWAPVESDTVAAPPGSDSTTRAPDPVLEAYSHAAATLKGWRCDQLPVTLCADILHRAADQCREPAQRDLLREVAGLLPIAAVAPPGAHELYSSIAPVHLSHEAVLPDESALTRRGPDRRWWDCSTHLLWIGDRTRNPAHRQVQFAAGVGNPVAVTLGPTATPHDVELLCRALNPDNRPGRLTLIARLGAARTVEALPALFEAAARCGTPVCWVCDPMPADTGDGHLFRRLDEVVAEIRAFFRACRATATVPGGLHLECAPEAGFSGGLDPAQTLQCVLAALAELRSAA